MHDTARMHNHDDHGLHHRCADNVITLSTWRTSTVTLALTLTLTLGPNLPRPQPNQQVVALNPASAKGHSQFAMGLTYRQQYPQAAEELVSMHACMAHAHARARAHVHAHAHAHTKTATHSHTRAHTHTRTHACTGDGSRDQPDARELCPPPRRRTGLDPPLSRLCSV